ncbi:MAG: DNA adenine methylase [Gemmatimonadales bacterium]
MGSKHRLLPWLHGIFANLDFSTVADPFCGSASVAYLLKCMGKSVHASDFLNFPTTIAAAVVANSVETLSPDDTKALLKPSTDHDRFIEQTFGGIFFSVPDLHFLDTLWGNLGQIGGSGRRALALTAAIRACMKRQPRGVFTVANDVGGGGRYQDGRRDLQLSLRDHFLEQVELLNRLVFDNGLRHSAERRDAFGEAPSNPPDLVYLDPPYVPRADDNCYVKRYHFLEGLSCYWQGVKIMPDSKVRKIEKKFTPFSYRRTALDAFDRLFQKYRASTIVLSYSENGYPDRSVIGELLGRYKRAVTVHERAHRYHFGNHANVSRAETTEYVMVGVGE